MPLLIDPTFALTQRGQTWAERVSKSGCSQVGVSDAFADLSQWPDVLKPYRPRLPFGYWAPRYYPFGPPIFTVRAHSADRVSSQLMAAGVHSAIAADIWTGLRGGAWLAARRLPTLDRFIQAEVPVIHVGPRGCEEALAAIAAEIGADLAAALGRRTRYLIRDASRLPDFDWAPPLALVALDAGPGTFY